MGKSFPASHLFPSHESFPAQPNAEPICAANRESEGAAHAESVRRWVEGKDAKMKLPDRVYHLAEASNWLSIQRYGLLSANNLFDLAGLRGSDRKQLEWQQRLR